MPFELGIAYSLHQLSPKNHFYVVMEKKRHRLDKTLSDLKMLDPRIHEGKGLKALQCVYESFHVEGKNIPLEKGRKIYKELVQRMSVFRDGKDTVFNLLSFRNIIAETIALLEIHS